MISFIVCLDQVSKWYSSIIWVYPAQTLHVSIDTPISDGIEMVLGRMFSIVGCLVELYHLDA